MKEYVKISTASNILGVCNNTIRNWCKSGKLEFSLSPNGTKLFNVKYLENFISKEKIDINDNRLIIGYCRVSTMSQKNDLETQIKNVELYCYSKGYSFTIIKDLGSGLNYKKKGLNELINLIIDNKVKKIILNYKDRLVRYGFEFFEIICLKHNVEIEIINNTEDLTFQEELVNDVLEIITVYSSKLYGSRSHKNKKILEESKKMFDLNNEKL